MDYMERALALARQALGRVSPNPAVGAVLVMDGAVVGEGFTSPPGGSHAEIVALEQAGPRARGATLYTTLEPCSHCGRTPPCTDALLRAGIAEVHFAVLDPNPLVAGKGKRHLEENGLRVIMGEREQEARRLNEAYFKFMVTRTPFIVAKFASSLDGKIATTTGDSHWITGEEARRRVHQMRATVDAVMTGIGTVLADDPQLTPRADGSPPERQPLRVVVDSAGRIPGNAQLFQQPGPVLVAVAQVSPAQRRVLEKAGAQVLVLPAEDARVDLPALLQDLGQRDITSVLVEAGGTLLGSLFDQRLVDKVAAFIAPKVIGGRGAPAPVEGLGHPCLSASTPLKDVTVEQVGEDILVTGYPAY